MYDQIDENLKRSHHALASVATIDGAGHYVRESASLDWRGADDHIHV